MSTVLGELKLMPPRTAMKVNCLVMRHLHFGSVRGDLQELRHEQPAAFAIQHLRPWLATASSSTQHLRPRPSGSHIQHPTPAHQAKRQPHSAEIRRWRRQSVQMGREICVCLSSSSTWQQRRMRTYIIRCGKGRIPMLRVSKSGPGAPDC